MLLFFIQCLALYFLLLFLNLTKLVMLSPINCCYISRSSSETRRYRGIIRWSSSQSQPRIHLLYPVTWDHSRLVLANLVTNNTIPEYQYFVSGNWAMYQNWGQLHNFWGWRNSDLSICRDSNIGRKLNTG